LFDDGEDATRYRPDRDEYGFSLSTYNNIEPSADTFVDPGMLPSRRSAADNSDSGSSYYQGVRNESSGVNTFSNDELEDETATTPFSFYQRSLQLAHLGEQHGLARSANDLSVELSPDPRRDSGMGSFEDLLDIPETEATTFALPDGIRYAFLRSQ
jgi:hypothetical protein